MDKRYVLDVKGTGNKSDYIISLNNINEMNNIDLDINSNLEKFETALVNENLKDASNILEVLNKLTEYGDKRISDATILFKAKDIVLFYEKMDKQSIINSMMVLIKIRKFFNFLSSQITFNSNDERFKIIDKIHEIRDSICIKNLLEKENYKDNKISLEDLEIVLEFKEIFEDNNDYNFIDNLYKSFENKLNNEIKNLNNYNEVLKGRYKEDFYCSDEYKSLNLENNIENYRDLIIIYDNYYLLYKFNSNSSKKEKEVILMKLLGNDFINLPQVYRYYVIENISNMKKIYTAINEFINEGNLIVENIRKHKDLNTIII